ncbi:MAG: hypothetical protein PUP91_16380 [Rhizonema sp. PD37]|nr:hypothetical protein [Rhizonema sp. PD37]
MFKKKTICITFAVVLCCSTVKPTIAQPVPVLALPLVSTPVGLIFIGTVAVGGIIWYIYQDRHHHRVRSRVAPSSFVHANTSNNDPYPVGTLIRIPGVVSRAKCEQRARAAAEQLGGEWIAECTPINQPRETSDNLGGVERINPTEGTPLFICHIKRVK